MRHWLDEIVRWRNDVLMLGLLVLLAVMAGRAAYLMIGYDNRLKANLAVMSRSAQSFERLNAHLLELNRMTTNIEGYSLGQIRLVLRRTTALVDQVNTEFQAQQDAWKVVQAQIAQDRISFSEIRQQLTEVQRLQADEILRLKTLLDESTRPSFYQDAWNFTVTFLLGVISSILATITYSWWRGRDKKRMIPAVRRGNHGE